MKTLFVLLISLLVVSINASAYGSEISSSLLDLFNMSVGKGDIAITWLGYHQGESLKGYASAGFVIKTSDNVIVIDPSSLLANDMESLRNVDAIFITHDHGDHFNLESTIMLQNTTGAAVIANPSSFSMLAGSVSPDKLFRISSGENMLSGFNIRAIPAEHSTENPMLYVIEIDGFRIFHGSDSAFVQELNEIESTVDVALVPAGDPSPTASPDDAFAMIQALQPSFAIPMHGTPDQMQKLAAMVQESDIQPKIIIPNPLEIISPFLDSSEQSKIPEWVRNIFVWYGQGQISESEVLNAISFLIENQMIRFDKMHQSMMNEDMMMQGMSFNVNSPIIMPLIDGYYDGDKAYFVHTEVSDSKMANMMSKMINFPTLHVPELKDISKDQVAKVYVFTNGIPGSDPYGGGPFMFQIDVFDSIPGQDEYSQFRVPYLVTWNDDANPRILTSESEILQAESDGDLSIEKSPHVVNAPMIIWEMQGSYGKTMGKTSMIPRMFESMPGVEGELTMVDEKNYIAIFKLHYKEMSMMGMNP